MRGIEESCPPMHHFHAVASELRFRYIRLRLDYLVHSQTEVGDRDSFLGTVIAAVNSLGVISGMVQYGFPHGLTGDRAGVNTGSSDDGALLDHDDRVAALTALHRSHLRGGARDQRHA